MYSSNVSLQEPLRLGVFAVSSDSALTNRGAEKVRRFP